MDPLEDIKTVFFQECDEQLTELEIGLSAIRDGDRDPETVNAVFRAVHSIKGGAGAFGLEDLVRFAHVFENTLDDVRANRVRLDEAPLEAMLRAADHLADLVRAARDGGKADDARSQALAEELRGGRKGEALPAGNAEEAAAGFDDFDFAPICIPVEDAAEALAARTYVVTFRPHAALYAKANETAVLLAELARLGEASVALDITKLPRLGDLEPESSHLGWTVTLRTQADEAAIREIFEFVDGDCDLAIAQGGGGAREAAIESPAAASSDVDPALAILRSVLAAASSPSPAAPEPAFSLAPAPLAVVSETPSPALDAAALCTTSAVASAGGESGGAHAPARPPATIRVDLERVDRLIDLVGELVINQAMLAQRVTECGLARASGVSMGLDELEHLTREIQDSVMAIRAQPVKSVFQRMPRLAREVAAMTGKQVRLVMEGENTEVDKTVIERLADPITHMIRNAIDHGLETTEGRLAAGKPAEGVVRLGALHRGGRIVIEVGDDGAGINRKRVKAIAIEKGLIPAEAALSDEEVDDLIFMPGFSTAKEVSDISGRGVGMDVVRRSVQALGGRISIASRPGLGSTFTMSLPLTLAVLDGMVVSVCGQTLVTPITAVIETLQPKPGNLFHLEGSSPLVLVRDTYVPLVDIGHRLGFREAPLAPEAGVALLVEREDGGRAAFLVDAIQGQRQVVIKSLEANYRKVTGIAAATILGDGRVALILDVDAMMTTTRIESFRSEMRLAS